MKSDAVDNSASSSKLSDSFESKKLKMELENSLWDEAVGGLGGQSKVSELEGVADELEGSKASMDVIEGAALLSSPSEEQKEEL